MSINSKFDISNIETIVKEMSYIVQIQQSVLISSQVSMAIQVEKYLGKHQGQRRDLKNCNNKNPDIPEHLTDICIKAKGRTEAIAAKLAGFSSRDTYRRAKSVVITGIPELISAMNNKTVSIYKASNIAKLSIEQQQFFLGIKKGGNNA